MSWFFFWVNKDFCFFLSKQIVVGSCLYIETQDFVASKLDKTLFSLTIQVILTMINMYIMIMSLDTNSSKIVNIT